MVRDKTLRSAVTAAATLSYVKAHNAVSKQYITAILDIISASKYLCTKFEDCPDMRSLCHRTTDEPCMYKVLNPRYAESVTTLENLKRSLK